MKFEKLIDFSGRPKYIKPLKYIAFKPQYIPVDLYPSVQPSTKQITSNDTIKKEE